jgi:hypothetical protein
MAGVRHVLRAEAGTIEPLFERAAKPNTAYHRRSVYSLTMASGEALRKRGGKEACLNSPRRLDLIILSTPRIALW